MPNGNHLLAVDASGLDITYGDRHRIIEMQSPRIWQQTLFECDLFVWQRSKSLLTSSSQNINTASWKVNTTVPLLLNVYEYQFVLICGCIRSILMMYMW
mmetsp:Transcript_1348/g.4670  ORF Transcript_1348/g.4670 Transcript_1348/m.4670 type:complete len:99 (+) Transcript_1348:1190-1486(+)